MPRISTYGAPAVAPVQSTNARFRAADNDGGAAGAIGRGLQQVGAAGADYVHAQFQIEEKLAKTNSDNLELNAGSSVNGTVADFKTKAGKLALDARPGVEKSIDEALKGVLAQADPRTKRYLEPQLARMRSAALNDVASYAVGQTKIYDQETGKAKFSNLLEGAVASDDPAKRSEFIANAKAQARENAIMAGLGGDEILAKVERDAMSTAHVAVVKRYMADKDYEMADAYKQAHSGQFNAGDEAEISADLAAPLLKRWASQKVDSLAMLPPIVGQPGKGVATAAGTPVTNGGEAIKALFPQAVVTSTYRAADHPLSKANPKSWHTKSHAAVDVKPIAGMSFAQYVKGVEGAGYTVLEARDEVGAGRSAHATGDHWHVVLGEGGGGTVPAARRWDMQALTQRIFAVSEREGWSIEQRDAALSEAKERVSLDETLKARQEDDAKDAALRWVLTKGDSFTDISQMPSGIRDNLPPEAALQFANAAKSNGTSAAPKANSRDAMRLHAIQHGTPDKFLNADLGEFVGKVTPAELDAAVTDQARMRGPGGDRMLQTRSAISTSIGYQTAFDPAMAKLLNAKENPENYARVARDMEGFIKSITAGKREPTAQEIDAAWKRAIMPVAVPNSSRYGQEVETKPRFAAGGRYQVAVPIVTRERIIKEWRDAHNGEMPPDGVIGDIYVQNKGKPEYWE